MEFTETDNYLDKAFPTVQPSEFVWEVTKNQIRKNNIQTLMHTMIHSFISMHYSMHVLKLRYGVASNMLSNRVWESTISQLCTTP